MISGNNDENYYIIDTKNEINSSMISTIYKVDNKLKTEIEKILNNWLSQSYSGYDSDSFLVCIELTNKIMKSNKDIKKYDVENSINFLLDNKDKFIKETTFNPNLELIRNIGFILLISYSQFNEYKINNKKELRKALKEIIKSKQDVLEDYNNECKERKIKSENLKKRVFWENNSHEYYLPGIYIFLMNYLSNIETIIYDFNSYFNEEYPTNDDINYFILYKYNMNYLFQKVIHIKINLIYPKYQKIIFSKYFVEYENEMKKINADVKIQQINSKEIYGYKWDFINDFLLYEKRLLTLDKKDEEKLDNKDQLSFSELEGTNSLVIQMEESNNMIIVNTKKFQSDIVKTSSKKKCSITNDNKNKNNKYFNTVKYILLTMKSLHRFKNIMKLDLTINISYNKEIFEFYSEEIVKKEIINPKDLNLIDIIPHLNINSFNIEFNSLDSKFFQKIINYINQSIIYLNISFFTSDICYFNHSLFNLYNNLDKKEKISRYNFEVKILDNLLNEYCINLQKLFNAIKSKTLQVIGFNFDIPDIISNNQKYMTYITKFIINVLTYCFKNDSIVQKLVLLAPKIKFQRMNYPLIDLLDNNNKILKELSCQFQLYEMININNFINKDLVVLSIGDCDMVTFKNLVYYISSYKFNHSSSLIKISISLIKTIRHISKELYNYIYRLFNIKIKQLEKINVYTNIILDNKEQYVNILKIFDGIWISSCKLTFNKKSDVILKKNEDNKKNIKYFVSSSLINILLSNDEQKNLNLNEYIKNADEAIYWILRYVLKIRYQCENYNNNKKKENNNIITKSLTNNILSYIFISKYVEISHNID